MNILARLCLFILILLCLPINLVAQTNIDAAKRYGEDKTTWETSLIAIEQRIKIINKTTEEERTEDKKTLRAIHAHTDEYIILFESELKAKQAFLDALGDNTPPPPAPNAPKDAPAPVVMETKEITQQRNELKENIAQYDAYVRTARLIAAQADENYMTIEQWELEQQRNQLFAKRDAVWVSDRLTNLSSDIERYMTDFNHPQRVVWLSFFMFLALLIGYRTTAFLNHWMMQQEMVTLRSPFSRRLLAGASLCAYISALLRFKATSFENYPAMMDVLGMISATYLAVVLFLMLLRVQFKELNINADMMASETVEEQQRSDLRWLPRSMLRLCLLSLLAVPPLCALGYINLGLYMALNIFMTLFACYLFVALRSLAMHMHRWLHTRILTDRKKNDGDARDQQRAEQKRERFSAMAIALIEPLLALLCVALIALFWGASTDDFEGWILHLQDGIVIGDITIHLPAIGEGMILFLILVTVTKIIQWFTTSRVFPHTSMDTGLQHAIITITGYAGKSIALLLALGAVGINMSNLAIIAGALSVGIGFGLQAVFNNFVSGLILLFERPFRVGDWIITGVHQGRIKNIRVRATEIETFQNASVIVPNSMLISDVVANWTLHNNVGRVDVAVSVAYGTDTRKVQKVLLDVARAHEQVRSYPKPHVLFMAFGESSLDFELRCHVSNIGDGVQIASDLRFAIEEAFRKHEISIPFPQREVHMHHIMDAMPPTLVGVDG